METGPPPNDHRGSWIPNGAMIAKRFMELRRRRGLMIALAVVTIGIPSIFLIVRLLAHAFDPKSYGAAGGYDIFTSLVSGVLYIFGFIVAAALGCTAGSIDLQEGVFRHLVVTGRSRVATYFARIPAGLAIVVAFVAIGYGIVCLVCSFAAPTVLNYDGVNVPAGLSRPALDSWASTHADKVICDFGFQIGPPGPSPSFGSVIQNVPCGNGPDGRRVKIGPPGAQGSASQPTKSEIRAAAVTIANLDYADYSRQFLSPSNSLMIRTGLWIALEAAIGFIVGLGLGSLTGQRTISVILMIVLEVILTPIFLRAHIPHMINFQRSIVGVATDHLGPSAIPIAGGGGQSDRANLISETRTWAAVVVAAWLVGWTALGAWRMASRDA
ncbi:MAG TPA: hypothetical protein VG368_03385 [Acidimicrobiales bacterium]|nr:hypothetical protein [Acidimicrobiales bacterium]